jgi:hypothetical protein
MATTCVLTSGYQLGCRDNIGGVAEVYIGEWNSSSMTYVLGTDNIIGTFSGATVSFYTFQQEIETASYTENGQFSIENGTSFYEQTLTITLHKIEAALRNKILLLGQGKWRVIVKDQRGKYHLMGYQNPVRVTASTPNLGKAYGDLNGAVITFMTKESTPAYEVAASAALQVITA